MGLVEKWSETADPTVPARMDQAEAFLRLRMMDRAWARLKPLIEAQVGGTRPYVLAARVFLDRGWPGKARKVVQQGLERDDGDDTLQALWEEASVDPEPFDTHLADDADAEPDVVVSVAEHFMTQGAFVRARSLLERVRRDVPDHRRANDLLWAIEGDYDLDEPIIDVVERCAPDLSTLADLADDSDHTESANLDDLPLQIERDADADRFPALFRSLEPTDQSGAQADEGEITAVSSLAEMKRLAEAAEAARAASGDMSEDTQIMRVVRKAGSLEPVAEGEAHVETPAVDSSFNLADFRREMGMQPPKIDSDVDFDVPDDEDENVVMVTKPELTEAAATPAGAGLTLDTSAEARAAKVQGSYDEERWADPNEPEAAEAPAPEPVAPEPKSLAEAAPRPSPPPDEHEVEEPTRGTPFVAWPWWLAVLAMVMGFGVVMFFLLAVAFMLQ